MNRNKKLILGSAIGAAVVVAGTGVAFGSIPGSDNSVTACVTSSTGAVRIVDVDAGQTCQTSETKVTWGGGMRFRGVWSVAPGTTGPGSVPYSSATVRKGDVIRYDGPSGQFGCTTPKGAWVNVAGSHAYPCLEFPQNWAPLALDGRPAAADTHWVNVNASGQVISASEPGVVTYPGTGYVYVTFPKVDVSKCGISVSVNDYSSTPVIPTASSVYTNYILATTRQPDGTWTSRPLSIVADCGKTS
jgi:hypothetical protein